MRIHKANYLHLYKAALYLAQSDIEEMDRIKAGRDPVEVLTASSGDPTAMAISDDLGNVLAVGGSQAPNIWFVHTTHAEALSPRDKLRLFRMLERHLLFVTLAARDTARTLYSFTNIVSPENHKHIKLLKALGAEWDETPLVHNGHPFLQFYF